jgi:hypothetical protein
MISSLVDNEKSMAEIEKLRRKLAVSENQGLRCSSLFGEESRFPSFGMYGGDDGARTRDLCRDRAAF